MHTLINGDVADQLSVTDRGLLYGDGLFETIAYYHSSLVLYDEHLARLTASCTRLRLQFNMLKLKQELDLLLDDVTGNGVVKIIVTRGQSGRGYKGSATADATRILQFFPHDYDAASDRGIILGLSHHRLAKQPALAGLKHLNRLDQVLASFDITGDLDEVLCLDEDGFLIEGSKSNLVVAKKGGLFIPDLSASGVEGVMLGALLKNFAAMKISVTKAQLTIQDLTSADEVFVCNSVIGVWPVIKLIENATVTVWPIGDICQLAKKFQHDIFNANN